MVITTTSRMLLLGSAFARGSPPAVRSQDGAPLPTFSIPTLQLNANNPYSCPEGVKITDPEENWKVSGPALGGWLVIEPWVTPSLFYQFLGTDEKYKSVDETAAHTAMDAYSFCTVLGDDEANRQLRLHWAAWVRDEDIKAIAAAGANVIRVPVPDCECQTLRSPCHALTLRRFLVGIFVPREPFIGCWDGALEELDRLVELCRKYNLKMLIDVHTAPGSQNGFDNSGRTWNLKWDIDPATGLPVFNHWGVRSADWIGTWDLAKWTCELRATCDFLWRPFLATHLSPYLRPLQTAGSTTMNTSTTRCPSST